MTVQGLSNVSCVVRLFSDVRDCFSGKGAQVVVCRKHISSISWLAPEMSVSEVGGIAVRLNALFMRRLASVLQTIR